MAIHHNFKKNSKILLITKNGTKIIDRYLDTKGNTLYCNNNEYKFKDLRCVTIYKIRKK